MEKRHIVRRGVQTKPAQKPVGHTNPHPATRPPSNQAKTQGNTILHAKKSSAAQEKPPTGTLHSDKPTARYRFYSQTDDGKPYLTHKQSRAAKKAFGTKKEARDINTVIAAQLRHIERRELRRLQTASTVN